MDRTKQVLTNELVVNQMLCLVEFQCTPIETTLVCRARLKALEQEQGQEL
jgi:hypothetical protein